MMEPNVDEPSCELLGRWHRWHTVEVVMDGSGDPDAPQRLNHAVRIMRCLRCGATSWRWTAATAPPAAGADHGDVRTVVHVRGPASSSAPA